MKVYVGNIVRRLLICAFTAACIAGQFALTSTLNFLMAWICESGGRVLGPTYPVPSNSEVAA